METADGIESLSDSSFSSNEKLECLVCYKTINLSPSMPLKFYVAIFQDEGELTDESSVTTSSLESDFQVFQLNPSTCEGVND